MKLRHFYCGREIDIEDLINGGYCRYCNMIISTKEKYEWRYKWNKGNKKFWGDEDENKIS